MRLSKEEKALKLEGWKLSGKSIGEYAKEQGINPYTFRGWVNRETKVVSGFVEIPNKANHEKEQFNGICFEKGGIKIFVTISVWVQHSKSILEGIKAAL